MIRLVPVSVGELWDKFTILLIKQERIRDVEKRRQVEFELGQLQSSMDPGFQSHPAFATLKSVNECLWDIEDSLRIKESEGVFDASFVELARQVYFTNDRRAHIKKQINVEFGSAIHEVKDYVSYAT
jgi:hypothetical protein